MLPIQFNSHTSIRAQLYSQLRDAILQGHLRSAQQLPATRSMATELGISRNTVLLAYEQLAAEGYLVSRKGAGTFVATALPTPGHAPGLPPAPHNTTDPTLRPTTSTPPTLNPCHTKPTS